MSTQTKEETTCRNCGAHLEIWKEVFGDDLDQGHHICFTKNTIALDKYNNDKPWIYLKENCKESAAAKRASLDLSRALSEMRR